MQVYEDKLDAEDVNAAIEYAMMKEGSATKSKHTSYNKLESDFYSSLGKLHRMDVYHPHLSVCPCATLALSWTSLCLHQS